MEKKINYIDLGLPSGTLWADKSDGEYYTKYQAAKKFGKNIPTSKQVKELITKCNWEWDKEKIGYKVTGPNGKSIFIEARSYKESDDFGKPTNNINSSYKNEGLYWCDLKIWCIKDNFSFLNFSEDKEFTRIYVADRWTGKQNYSWRNESMMVRLIKQ